MEGKVAENRLRRHADRLGLILRKSRARQWSIDNHGEYMLVDVEHGGSVAGHRYDLDLDEVGEFLKEYESDVSA